MCVCVVNQKSCSERIRFWKKNILKWNYEHHVFKHTHARTKEKIKHVLRITNSLGSNEETKIEQKKKIIFLRITLSILMVLYRVPFYIDFYLLVLLKEMGFLTVKHFFFYYIDISIWGMFELLNYFVWQE